MSPHYFVKLKMLIVHILPLSCYRKKLQKSSYCNCGLLCKRRCRKHASPIWIYWRCHWQMAAAM